MVGLHYCASYRLIIYNNVSPFPRPFPTLQNHVIKHAYKSVI